MQLLSAFAILAMGMGLGTGRAEAGPFFRHPHERGTPPAGKPRQIPHTHERAGYPLCVSGCAQPSYSGHEHGHYVGGGGGGPLHQADPRCRHEGTWGWDYVGWYPRKVFLGWNHGRRYQGGTAYYRTDPPFEVPNIFATELPKLHHRQSESAEE
jgi:hypothetical protein